MCNSFNKKQQRLRARRRASRNKPAQQRRRVKLIACAVAMVRFVLSELDLREDDHPRYEECYEESGPRLRKNCYYCGGGCLHGQPCPGLPEKS